MVTRSSTLSSKPLLEAKNTQEVGLETLITLSLPLLAAAGNRPPAAAIRRPPCATVRLPPCAAAISGMLSLFTLNFLQVKKLRSAKLPASSSARFQFRLQSATSITKNTC
ncbi:hypothetical protein L1987_55690 [Smallanthus sonchifolius]|uniref:Uncharacterized protein n=1 Tax=Smallanthus sonchifolius TaxID=185202 RepID=A0ACB9EAR6_9ASTR|nr:hypothetical protein L1987_55690 [Smallanthus sonchifolius]